MDTLSPLNENQPEYFYSHHLVAFLDLLGQKDRLCEIEGILNSDQPELQRETVQRVLKDTVGAIWSFRESFSSFFDQYLKHQPSISIPDELKAHFYQMRAHSKLGFQSFSDSTIVWTPIRLNAELDYPQVLNSILGVLTAVGMLTPLYLSKKVPLRGGIDIEGGILLRPNGNEIYGPALNRAYVLESKIAKSPRVLIGRGLLDFLTSISEVPFQDDRIKRYCIMMAEQCQRWIAIDYDNLPMVHFLGPSARDLLKDMPEGARFFQDILEPLRRFILESEEKFKGNGKLSER